MWTHGSQRSEAHIRAGFQGSGCGDLCRGGGKAGVRVELAPLPTSPVRIRPSGATEAPELTVRQKGWATVDSPRTRGGLRSFAEGCGPGRTRGCVCRGWWGSKHPNTKPPNSTHPNSKWTQDAESLSLGCPGLWEAGGHGILCDI